MVWLRGNFSTVIVGGQLSQFVFLQSNYCSPFQQIFLLGFGNVFCIPQKLNIYALNSDCLTIEENFFKKRTGV